MKRSLARVRRYKVLWHLTQLAAAAFFALAVYTLYLKRYGRGLTLLLCGFVSVLLLIIPAWRQYRAVWRAESALQAYGRYAAQVELDEDPEPRPDQLLMLSLIPLRKARERDYRFRCRVGGYVRSRPLAVTELTLPVTRDGKRAELDACLIHMTMPRAPIQRLLIADTRFGRDAEALAAFYRRNLRLMPLEIQLGRGLLVLGDGQLPDKLTMDRLETLFRQCKEPMVLSLEGREMNLLIRNGKALLGAPVVRLNREKLERMPLPQLPQLIDLAFDTADLTAGEDVAVDDSLDRKLAGVPGQAYTGDAGPGEPALNDGDDDDKDAPGDL